MKLSRYDWLLGKIFIRKLSEYSNPENCRQWVSDLKPHDIPRTLFEISFARSSGPGGQNVNKLNTKACIKMSHSQWSKQTWIPQAIKEQLEANCSFTYLTKSQNLVVQSDRTRSRHENLEDCFQKLCNSIKNCVHFESNPSLEDIKKWEKISLRSNSERLDKKKRKSQKKQSRRQSFDD